MDSGPHPLEASALASWLQSACAGPPPVRQGFAAVLMDERDGAMTAATSSRLEIALHYTVTEGRLLCATHLRDLVGRLPTPPPLDVAKMADLMALHDDPSTTVFAGVSRLPVGHMLRWAPGRIPSATRWFRPEDTEPLRLLPGAEVELMRETIRDAVAVSLPPTGDVTATLSGGLDSSMVVAIAASLLHPDHRTVHTATHVPLPGTPNLSPGWESDDGPYARAMTEQVPGLTWTCVMNESRTSPIEALMATFASTYSPSLNSANLVWIRAVHEWVEGRRLPLLLTGSSGNAPFSRGRSGIVRNLLGRGAVMPILRQIRARHRTGDSGAVAARGVAADVAPAWLLRLYQRARGRKQHAEPSFSQMMPLRLGALSDAARDQLARLDVPQRMSHNDWVRFVLRDGMLSTLPQAMLENTWWSDPLSDPEVVTLALSLPPEAWIRDGRDRSLARRCAEGLVPDHIRLRTTRGGQSADVGLWMQGKEQVYREAMELVVGSRAAPQFLDVEALSRSIAAGLPAPGREAVTWDNTHGRALGFGLFAAWYEQQILSHRSTGSIADSIAVTTSESESTTDGRTTSTTGTPDAN